MGAASTGREGVFAGLAVGADESVEVSALGVAAVGDWGGRADWSFAWRARAWRVTA